MSERTILHADMDAFYAAIEQRDDPDLRGRPVVVGGGGPRGVVATASYEARRFGVHSAMPGAEARRRCPQAVFVAPRMDVYVAEAARIRQVFESFTPLVEPLSLDEAFLDVTASRALFGDGVAIATRLRHAVREATGLTVSVGVATSKFVAKVASDLDKPDGLTVVPPGTERAFLDPLPIARLWGAGPVTQERLAALGLATIGELRRTPRTVLATRIGASAAAHLAALAHADDPRLVVPDRDARSVGHETTFPTDVHDDEELYRVLLRLCEAVAARLRRAGTRAAQVRLKLRFPPFRTLTRQTTLDAASDDELQLYGAARALLDAARRPGQPVRLIGVTAAGLADGAAPRQQGLFDAPAERPERRRRLLDAVDRIRDRFGDDAIRHGG